MAVSGTNAPINKTGSQDRADLVAYWSIPMIDGVHTVEFEHGTTSGKRVLRVDGKEILRRDWMFKLVGEEQFVLGKQRARCELRVDPLPHFAFSYSLLIDGKPLEKFTEKQSQSTTSWVILVQGKRYRILFEKQTLNVWINGGYVDTENVFVDDGTEMRFNIDDLQGVIKASSGNRKEGVVHKLFIDGTLVEEDTDYLPQSQ